MPLASSLAATYPNQDAFIGNGSTVYTPPSVDNILVSAGWSRQNIISGSAGAENIVYWSAGESGTESFYLQVQATSATTTQFSAYTYFPQAGSLGYNGYPTTGTVTVTTGSSSYIAWIVADKNGICVATKVSGTYYLGSAYGLFRLENPGISGKTYLTTAAALTGSTPATISVAAYSNITVGQKLFISDAAGANATVPAVGGSGNFIRATVGSLPSGSSITLTPDPASGSFNFAIGALVAIDPQPFVLSVNNGNGTQGYNRGTLNLSNVLAGPGAGSGFTQTTFATNTLLLEESIPQNFSLTPSAYYTTGAGVIQVLGYNPRMFCGTTSQISPEDTVAVGTDSYTCFGSGNFIKTTGVTSI